MSRQRRRESLLASLATAFLLAVSTAASGAPPSPPANFSIQAAPTDQHFQLRVTWTDFADEDGYQLFASGNISPGPIIVGSGSNTTWRLVQNLSSNRTDFLDSTMVGQTYGVCALKGQEMTCSGASNFALPTYPPEPATVDSLNITSRGTDSLRVSWTQSANTVYSRAWIIVESVNPAILNDADQSVMFTGLSPNRDYDIRVCVRNQQQTPANETCRSTTAKTLPSVPLAVSSVSVNQSDPSPTARTVSFTYNNQPASAVVGFSVRLIKDNQVLANTTLYPASASSFGERTYSHTFTNLSPFTGYEASVIPYNRSGPGTSAGIGFTTPVLLQPVMTPLSGDSAMLRWWGAAPGEFAVEKRLSSGAWQLLGSYISLAQGINHRVVIDDVTSAQTVRVTWKLAYLRSQSEPVSATALAAGTPELLDVRAARQYVPEAAAFGNRFTVSFRATAASSGQYILQGRTSANDWTTVDSLGSLQPSPINTFSANTVYALNHVVAGSRPTYRICKNQLAFQVGGAMRCSATSDQYVTAGLRRFDVN